MTASPEESLAAAEVLRYTYRVALGCRGGYQELDGAIHREIPAEGEAGLDQIAEYALVGDVAKVTDQLTDEIESYRPSQICLSMGMGDHARSMRSLETLGSTIIPELERRLGPLDAIGPASRVAAK